MTMTEIERLEANLLAEARMMGLYDSNARSIRLSAEAEREGAALLAAAATHLKLPSGKEGKRTNGKAARPVANGGGKNYGTARLQTPTAAERRAIKLAKLRGEVYVPAST